MNRLIFPRETADQLARHLEARTPLEEGAFCLLRRGRGARGQRLLVGDVLLPPPDAWTRQAENQLRPSTQWLSAVIGQAIQAKSGLLFLHSHPNPDYPLGLSLVDEDTFRTLARAFGPGLPGPFAAAVAHPCGWSAVLWSSDDLQPIQQITSIGRTLRLLSPAPPSAASALDSRQRDALGIIHDRIRQLSVGIVGCGGLGSPIAEQLVRMGVRELVLVDNDVLDTPSNVRRVFGSTMADIQVSPPLSKVDILARHLDQLGLAVSIRPIRGDIRNWSSSIRDILDVDVVIAGTDTHGSRAALNELPRLHLLPVIDAGVRVGSKRNGNLSNLLAAVRVLTPSTPCLLCRRTIDPDTIRIENLPEDERSKQIREGYVTGTFGAPEPSVVALTALGSGLATCALLTLLAEDGDVAPVGHWVDGFIGNARSELPAPQPSCRCRSRIGFGDD